MPITIQPFPLGKITATAGTPVKLTSNFSSDTEITKARPRRLEVEALSTNTQKVYIGTATMNKTTLAGVIKILDANETWLIESSDGCGEIPVDELYLDTSVSGEGVYANMMVI